MGVIHNHPSKLSEGRDEWPSSNKDVDPAADCARIVLGDKNQVVVPLQKSSQEGADLLRTCLVPELLGERGNLDCVAQQCWSNAHGLNHPDFRTTSKPGQTWARGSHEGTECTHLGARWSLALACVRP